MIVPSDWLELFLDYIAQDDTANCSGEIYCLQLDGFDLNNGHKLSSNEKKSQQSRDSNPGLLGGKQECFLCATKSMVGKISVSEWE